VTQFPRIIPGTPRLDASTFAVGHTAQGSHGFALADLADDAAVGHPSQRITLPRTTGATFHGWYTATDVVRLARVTVVSAWRGAAGTWVAGDGVRVELSATDGTATVSSSSTLIPPQFRPTPDTMQPAYPASTRVSSAAAHSVVWDVGALAATLDRSLPWRFTFTVTCDATAVCEAVTVEELPRWIVDDALAAGIIPTHYQPRAIIDAGTQSFARINTTTRWAYYHTPRTFHCGSPGETDPYVTTSTSYTSLGGDTDDGAARVWTVRPYILRGASSTGCRAQWTVRYRITGASSGDKAYVRLTTGAGTYTLTLADVSGAWTDASPATAYLSTASTKDTLAFTAKVDAGTLSLSARQVWSYPE